MNLDVRYKSCAVYIIHSVNMTLIKPSVDLDGPQNANIFEGMSKEICATVGFNIGISRHLEYFCKKRELELQGIKHLNCLDLIKRFHLSSANLSLKRVNGWEINAVGQKENGKMLPMLRLVHAMVYKMRAGPG